MLLLRVRYLCCCSAGEKHDQTFHCECLVPGPSFLSRGTDFERWALGRLHARQDVQSDPAAQLQAKSPKRSFDGNTSEIQRNHCVVSRRRLQSKRISRPRLNGPARKATTPPYQKTVHAKPKQYLALT